MQLPSLLDNAAINADVCNCPDPHGTRLAIAMSAPVRVLVVDDDHIVADSLSAILRGRSFDSRATYSGEDAAMTAIAWNPDAVITAVIMGEMDGVALSIYLAQSLATCRVLLLPGNLATEKLLNQSKDIGHVVPILAKPFHPDQVFEFLRPSGMVPSA